MTRKQSPAFPAPELPQSRCDQKLLGLYPQRPEGLMLQRVRIPGGRITTDQLTALARAAQRVGARYALHLTTRQDIEFHCLMPAVVPSLQVLIERAGLTTVGSAGDTVRNSTVDPLGGVAVGNYDLLPLARTIELTLQSLDEIWSLPRKFKISLSGDANASMRPWMSDVGVVANPDGTYLCVVAGSLGHRPLTGIVFSEAMTQEQVAALVIAAVRFHDQEGDREKRMRARLRHVRERMGDAAFLERLHTLMDGELETPLVDPVRIPDAPTALNARPYLRLAVPHGDLPIDLAMRLADCVHSEGGEIRIGIEHDLYVIGVDRSELPDEAADWISPRRVVACPGAQMCTKAVGSTHDVFQTISSIAEKHPKVSFAVSGCPNSCSHAVIAGVGVIAGTKRVGDTREPVYKVLSGGESGRGPGMARMVAEDVTKADLAHMVEHTLSTGL